MGVLVRAYVGLVCDIFAIQYIFKRQLARDIAG